MDYRNFDHGRPSIPPRIRRHLRRLKPVGILVMVCGVVIPFLTVLKILTSTYFLNFFAFILMVLGPIMYLVGLTFDSYVDRAP